MKRNAKKERGASVGAKPPGSFDGGREGTLYQSLISVFNLKFHLLTFHLLAVITSNLMLYWIEYEIFFLSEKGNHIEGDRNGGCPNNK